MDLMEIEKTEAWKLYEKSVNFLRIRGLYDKADTFNRFYIGDQWHGVKLSKSVEPITHNFIKQMLKQKIGTITENLFAINYSPENIENIEFMAKAQATCDLLNKKASKAWDLDKMDSKIKKWVKKAGITGESVCYVNYIDGNPVNEILALTDVMYGDENEPEIQKQPYILVRQRLTIAEIQKKAKKQGLSADKIFSIVGDNDTSTVAGDAGKNEIDDKTWLITKFYKDIDGNVLYSQSTMYVDIVKDEKMGIKLYPIAHLNWEDEEGNARGVGEVEYLVPNQLETNKTALRRAIVVKKTAYPQKVVNVDAIQNPQDVDRVGATIKFKEMGNTRASDVFMNTTPAQMSNDAEKLQSELISLSKELSNAGDATTGNIDPSSASGKAILAVQQAQTQPLNDQTMALKTFIEDIARIWFAYWKNDTKKMVINYTETDLITGEEKPVQERVDKTVLKNLETSVKVDITPRGAYDKYAQELSLENLMQGGFITFEEYVKSLDTDSVMPKVKLQQILDRRKEAQQRINAIDIQAEQMKQQSIEQQTNAQTIAGIQAQGNADYAQALNKAQETAYGSDRERTDVSNNNTLT